MMNERNMEKMNALAKNPECQQKLAEAATPEEVCDILKQYGMALSVQEVKELIKEEEAELTDQDLDTVAGGCHGFRHVVGFRIVWGPVTIIRGKIIYGPILVPVYCKRR